MGNEQAARLDELVLQDTHKPTSISKPKTTRILVELKFGIRRASILGCVQSTYKVSSAPFSPFEPPVASRRLGKMILTRQ